MRYSVKRLAVYDQVVVDQIDESEFPPGLSEIMNKYEIDLADFLLEYQQGKQGFRSVGTEIGGNEKLGNEGLDLAMSRYNEDCKILRASENKRTIGYLILNKWLPVLKDSDLVLLTFNKSSIGKFLFDSTQIQVEDIQEVFELLCVNAQLKKKVNLYVVAVQELDNYYFEETFIDQRGKKYYKLKERY